MIAYIAIPALIALIVKLALLGFAARAPARSETSRLFLALLAAFALHNLAEFLLLSYYSQHGLTPTTQLGGFAYMATIIPVIALILHVSLRLGFDFSPDDTRKRLQLLLYLPALVLLFLLLFTDQLVVGFQPFKNTLLRVPGPWYVLFEIYLPGYVLVALPCLIYGGRANRTSAVNRQRSRWWLLALSPTALLLFYLILANHFGLAKLTSTIYLPITWTFFLIVTTYVTTGSWKSLPTQQYRLFDLDYFIPWSRVRQRKNAFYARIRQTIAELTNLASVDDALARVSELLRCPVALVSGRRPVLAHAGVGSLEMAQFPHDELDKLDRVVVANEIAETNPQTCQLMNRFGVAAVVPYHPHTRTAATWMLLGDSFSDSVYTPLDFRQVQQLFDRLGEFFLDRLGSMQLELAEAENRIGLLQGRLDATNSELHKVREETALLRDYNLRLLRENRDARSGALDQPAPMPPPYHGKPLDEHVQGFEAQLIRDALRRCDGRKSDAARLLGLRPNTLHYKIRKYRLAPEEPEQGD